VDDDLIATDSIGSKDPGLRAGVFFMSNDLAIRLLEAERGAKLCERAADPAGSLARSIWEF
jgi:hypothetical protein